MDHTTTIFILILKRKFIFLKYKQKKVFNSGRSYHLKFEFFSKSKVKVSPNKPRP